MTHIEQIQQAITLLESQRAALGDAVVDAAIAPLRLQLITVPSTPAAAERHGERKFVTVLFADIAGFTALSETLDPEAVRDLMNACFERLTPIVAHYEGMVDKFMGDGMMVLFGAPQTHENDPERALRAALEMMDTLQTFNAERGLDLALHFGINTGTVVAGGLGTHDRQEYSVMGDVVNVAARFEQASTRDEILVGAETYRLTAPFFEFDALTPLLMKGKSGPVPAYRLRAVKIIPGKARGIAGLDSPLVGRDFQVAVLQQKISALRAGQGGIVTLWGEAGLGKSRLMSEIRSYAQSLQKPGVHWLEGRCLSYGSAIAYLPWLDVLRAALNVTPDAVPETVRQALRAYLQTYCPDCSERLYPYLGHLLSLPLEDDASTEIKGLDANSLKAVTFQAVETLLTHLAAHSPLVIIGEDMHWADATSLELWENLLPLVEENALLFVAVMRPEEDHPSWRLRQIAAERYAGHHTDISVEPLSAAESEALVGNLLHVDQLPPHLREKILKHAEGNPFYTEEIIRSLMDTNAITYDEATGLWQATRDVEEIELPDTLQGVLMARIDRLQADTKRVLQLAAVIGRSFMYRVLAEIAREEQDLDERIVSLMQQQMIRERARLPELEYIFKHQLTQEAAYNGLLKKERATFHAQVAQALEQLFPDRSDELVGLLAHHWECSGDTQKALFYLQRAAQVAADQYANAEAAIYYEKALALLPAGDPTQQFDLLWQWEAVSDYIGDRERQANIIRRLEALAEATGNDAWRSGVALRWANLFWNQGHFLEAVAKAQEAVRLGEIAHQLQFQAEGYMTWGRTLMFQQKYTEARQVLMQGLTISQQAGKRIEGIILRNIGNVLFFMGEHPEARTYVERALEIHRQQNDIPGQAAAYNSLGLLAEEQQQKSDCLEKSLELYHQCGHRFGQGLALSNLSSHYADIGQLDKALEVMEQTRLIWKRAGNDDGLAAIEAGMGHTSLRIGDYEATRRHFLQALKLREKSPNESSNADLWNGLGWVAENTGNYDEARQHFGKALSIWQQLENKIFLGVTQFYLGFVEYRLGRFAAATACYRQVLEDFTALNTPGTVQAEAEIRRSLALAALQRGEYQVALEESGRNVEIARQRKDHVDECLALFPVGYAQAGLGHWSEANQAFSEALEKLRSLSYRRVAQADMLAGLATVALAQGDLGRARALAAEIGPHIQQDGQLSGSIEPMQIYLARARVFQAAGDPSAPAEVSAACALIEERAARIADPTQRQSYLAVSFHQELFALRTALSTPGTP